MTIVRMGISTCPNDTFAMHGLLTGAIDTRGLDFQIELLDIQQLNDGLFAGRFDVAKASFHAALMLTDTMRVLPSGSALGFGVGPLLLSSEQGSVPQDSSQLTLCPGQHTTAALLFQLFYPGTTRLEHRVFSEIMPMLGQRQADFGVCIHEGRFTWQDAGLGLVEDLGVKWETETQHPLPLGGLLGCTGLPQQQLRDIQAVIHDSLQFALAEPDSALPSMRKYAQEFDDQVLMKHVELYVNDWTVHLGEQGSDALAELSRRGRDAGLIEASASDLMVFDL